MMKKLTEFCVGKKLAWSLAFLVFGSVLPLFTYAQDVILNPGYISGTISITGETISSTSVSASGSAGSASTSTSSGSYTLTVNVPQGSSAAYSVYASSYFSIGGYLSFPSQSVTVYENATTTANFNINPGYIQATITATSGTVSSFYLYAYGGGGSSSRSFSGSSGSIPVVPSSSVTVYGTAYFSDGGYASLSSQTVSVGAGDTIAVSWTVSPPPPTTQGTITGTIQMSGATADQHYVYASGPSYKSQSLSANGPYSLTNLNEGNYGVYAYSYFNNYTSYLYHPYSSFDPNYYVTVTGGDTTNVNISTDAAFINGTLKLTGTKSLSQTSSASMTAYGVYQTNSYGGSAGTSPNLQTGAYSLVVSEGSWSPYYFNFYFYNTNPTDPSDYLYEYIYFYDYQSYYNPIAVAAGETVTKNLTYGTGSVTVNFGILGGGTLSYPSLYGSCYKYNENNQLQSYYYFYSYGNQSNVDEGSVTFVGMECTCTIDAYAYVGGSYTKFGTLTIDVVPGASQVIDIGGPTLTVTYPEPDYITSNPTITVTGTASDDVAVDSVTVNGFSATTDPSTPAASVSFGATISLNYGPNQIQTVATDTSGKTGSDTRTVYRDEGPPTLIWTPADGSSSSSPNITVQGTATDDAGIKSITINGVEVTFESTNNPGDPNEVSFSVPLTLPDGDNFIEIVAMDISNQSTIQTHKVTVGQQDTTPPETSIGLSGAMGNNGWFVSNVTVALSATDETGGSGVAFTEYSIDGGTNWSNYAGPFVISSEGMTTVHFRSQDNAGNMETAKSAGLKIDKTPPTIIGSRSPGPNGSGWNNTDVTVSFSCSDGVSGLDSCSSPTTLSGEGAGQSVTGTAADLAGNTAAATVGNINIDKTPPSLTGLPAVGACTLWPPNHNLVSVATVTSNDGLSGAVSFSVVGQSNEPENGTGDGDTAPDIVITGGNVQLRSERSGGGTGRIYTLVATTTDKAGNATTATCSCVVPHDQRKK
ncbi:MAG: hypothetical protein HY578_08760 [Nitrospinae bacterium]|nr:hypothetical protein [Nitrospinota bacterium]